MDAFDHTQALDDWFIHYLMVFGLAQCLGRPPLHSFIISGKGRSLASCLVVYGPVMALQSLLRRVSSDDDNWDYSR